MPRGGKRPGAGRPKGSKEKSTFDKELLRAELREMVRAHLAPMVEAQIDNAKGIKFLIVRQKSTGRFLRVTESMAKLREGKQGRDEEVVEVYEKDPSVQAFTDLLNRTIDKPPEQIAAEVTHGGKVEFEWVTPK